MEGLGRSLCSLIRFQVEFSLCLYISISSVQGKSLSQDLKQILSKVRAWALLRVAFPLPTHCPPACHLPSFLYSFFRYSWVWRQAVHFRDRISINISRLWSSCNTITWILGTGAFAPRFTKKGEPRAKKKENSHGLNQTLTREKCTPLWNIKGKSLPMKNPPTQKLVEEIDQSRYPRFITLSDLGPSFAFTEKHFSGWRYAESAGIRSHSLLRTIHEI